MYTTLEVGKRIHANSFWMGQSLLTLANQALTDFEQEKYQDSAAKVGVCLEGVLKHLLESWELPFDERLTFGQLIGVLRNSSQAPKALLDRLGEANNIRIRAAHHSPDAMQRVTEGDALLILNILDMVVNWCADKLPPDSSLPPADLPIFLSVGSGHRLEQEQFLEHLRHAMRSLGVELRNLDTLDYSEDKPFDQIREVMQGCRAALIVGLERSHAYTVFERERSKRQKLFVDQYIPTAWNQIEGAMGSVLQLPVLVLKEKRLHDEGIFEADNHRHRREVFDLSTEAAGLSRQLHEVLASWVKHVRSSVPSGT